MTAEQMPLDLPVRPARGRDAFMVAPSNAVALGLVDRWPDWPGGRLALVGPEGAGKSHLAGVWAERADALVIAAADLGGTDPVALGARAVAVEDVDAPGAGLDDAALFHLWNAQGAQGGSLLLTGRRAPALWPVRLPDLASRLHSLTPAAIEAPDDRLMAALLVKHFADRQLRVAPALIDWLVPRMERSAAAAASLAARLDREALARGVPPSRALARELLGL